LLRAWMHSIASRGDDREPGRRLRRWRLLREAVSVRVPVTWQAQAPE